MSVADRDTLTIALGEIHTNAGALIIYAQIVRDYCELGDLEGLERAIRSALTHIRLIAAEFRNLSPLANGREAA